MSTNSFSLDGRVAIVTGAGGLLGRRHCEALANAGAVVYACDMDASQARAVANKLRGNHVGMFIDVTDKNSVDYALAAALADHGRIDILVNNAAVNDAVEKPMLNSEQSAFEHYPLELFRKVMDVNVTGMFLTSQIVGTQMVRQRGGSIINIASTYGVTAPDQRLYQDEQGRQLLYKSPAYPASKGAVIMLTKFLATYWGNVGVRANSLSPGGVENGQSDVFQRRYVERTPLARMAAPSEYEGALVFLASDASAYMTGHNLIMDGGWTAW